MRAARARGLTVVEVIVVLAIIVVTAIVLLMMLPRGREEARLVGCRNNLRQIGIALAMYDQFEGHLPLVAAPAALDDPAAPRSPGPLRTLLATLQLPDFTELTDAHTPPSHQPGVVPGEVPVIGFVCSSDPNATAGGFSAPVSYRATTGDTPAGSSGAFAPGRVIKLQQIEAADGLSYTAGFAERLVGDRQKQHAALGNYQAVPGIITGEGCPEVQDPAGWRSDAGSSWAWADYRSTLYHHALRPNGQPSCIAVDGQTSFMGASSGHVRGVNLLLLDGSVSLVRPSIDLKVWKDLAAIGLPPNREPEN